jgi:hypothetical protein
MPTPVTDSRSNANDQIAHAVKAIGRSADRLAVFEAIYHGKGRKTPEAVAKRAGIKRKRVLEEAIKLVKQHIVVQDKDPTHGLVYAPDSFYDANKKAIVRMVRDPKKVARLPTKVRPHVNGTASMSINVPRKQVRAKMITVDDIDSFAKVKKAKPTGTGPLPEKQFKYGVARILGEKGEFTDWGGEHHDLYSTNVKIKGKRVAAAFGFKGPGTTGILTPKKMGKNGDQIQRLFHSPASLFVVQYWGQIDPSIYEEMQTWAQMKSFWEETDVWYCIIDAADSARLVAAYATKFKGEGSE